MSEYFVINGYDDTGYLFAGSGVGAGHKPWTELGDSDIGILEVAAICRGEVVDDAVLFCRAIEFAVAFATTRRWLIDERNKLEMSGANAIEEAIDAYATSRDQLKIVSEQFPFSGHDPEHLKETTRVRRSVEALRNTVIAEQRAISALQDILAT